MNRIVLYKSTSLIPFGRGESSVQTKSMMVQDGPFHPKRETLRLTSLDVFLLGPIFHFVIDYAFPLLSSSVLFLRNALYCVCLTGVFIGGETHWVSPFVMASTGYIARMYELVIFPIDYDQRRSSAMIVSSVNAVAGIVGMTLFLQAASWMRDLTDPPVLLSVMYAALWVRSQIFSRGVCNVCNIFNLCSWISLILAAIFSSMIYGLVQSQFRGHPFLSFLDMMMASHLLKIVPSQDVDSDEEDNLVLLIIRSTFGWVTVAVHRLLRDMFLVVVVYIPLLAILMQELGPRL